MFETCQAFEPGKPLHDDNKCSDPVIEGKSYCEKHYNLYHRKPHTWENNAADYK